MKPNNPLLFFILGVFIFCSCIKKDNNKTCSDGIQNQKETGIDCGGPCSPCGTCSDGIQNQNETNIDCGGVCSKCMTCSDGIQNQGETGIDCGGPCSNVCGIIYPEFGSFGKNLLFNDTTVVLKAESYSLKCQIPAGGKIKVTMQKLDAKDGIWYYVPGSPWSVTPYANSYQEFTAVGPVIADVHIMLSGSNAVELRIYENGSNTASITRGYLW